MVNKAIRHYTVVVHRLRAFNCVLFDNICQYMWCDAIRQVQMQYNTIPLDTIRCDMIRYDMICDIIEYNTTR